MIRGKKLLKDESGQSVVLFAVAFVIVCGFAAFVVDVGSVSIERTQLQNVADAAALAAAQDLPDASAAKDTAIYYAGLNGVDEPEVTVTSPYDGDAGKIEVVCTETVEYTFARVLGYTSKDVSARAVAETGSIGGAFNYALFAGSEYSNLALNMSGLYVEGSVHSNDGFSMNGSDLTITGAAEAVTQFSANGSDMTVGGVCQGSSISVSGSSIDIESRVYEGASVIEMPDFSDTVQSVAEAEGEAYYENKSFNGGAFVVDSNLYVDGNMTVNGGSFTGTGTILATGDISFNISSLQNSTDDSVCFYTENGNININGSSIELNGILYAPNGKVSFNCSSIVINGRVIADEIAINCSSFRIISGSDDLDCLPQTSVRLSE